MARYLVSTDVRVQVHHAMLGAIEASFAAGEITPRSEEEAAALEHLVATGHAAVIEHDASRDPARARFEAAEQTSESLGTDAPE